MKRLTGLLMATTIVLAGGAAKAQDETLSIVFTHHGSSSNTFWQAVQRGFNDACERLGADCQMVFTQSEGSIEQQSANMQAALARNPHALITSIVDDVAFDGIISEARAAGITVIAANTDDSEGAAGNERQAFVGQGTQGAGYALARAMADFFPEEGPINVLLGISEPGQNWSEQRGQGVVDFLEEYREANPDREISWERINSGTDLAITADRVGAHLNANPDTNVYFDTGYWHAAVARVLRDQGVEPGEVLLGGFDLVPEVLQEMQSGYVQVQVDQQPYMQGFLPVMQAYLAHNFNLSPSNIDTGQGIVYQEDVPDILELSAQGVR